MGHWGTTPGQNFIYVHLNRVIKKYDLDMIYVSGPGHGGPAAVANTYLEGTYSETGLRNSEITALRHQDVELGVGAHVRCVGKGRKMRCTPLRPDVVAVLKGWLSGQGGKPEDPVFPSSNGGRLSADALQRLVLRHFATARRTCPSLASKTVTPHTLRHAAAMALLRGGVDLTVIALWLGHESTVPIGNPVHGRKGLAQGDSNDRATVP